MPETHNPAASMSEHEPQEKSFTIWLVTPEQFNNLPDGTELVSIIGNKVVKGTDSIDTETTGGLLGFGLTEQNVTPEIRNDRPTTWVVDAE